MLIEIIKAIILGVVEGLTEFLPISSTGHLILINEWVSFSATFTKVFDVVIQLGAILAVIVYFWPKLWPFGKNVTETDKKRIFTIWWKTIVGVIPALVIGAALGSWIESKLFNPWVVAGALIVGGLIIIFVERKQIAVKFASVADMPWSIVIYIGLRQCLAMIPGTSRAAATIIGALLLGISRVVAVEFSFFLAIPTMIAASSYSLLKHGAAMSGGELVLLAIGFVTSFAVALFVIRFFVKYIKVHDFKAFGYYRIVLGVLVVIYFLVK
jgi:undecaprenyl-diphosphatase